MILKPEDMIWYYLMRLEEKPLLSPRLNLQKARVHKILVDQSGCAKKCYIIARFQDVASKYDYTVPTYFVINLFRVDITQRFASRSVWSIDPCRPRRDKKAKSGRNLAGSEGDVSIYRGINQPNQLETEIWGYFGDVNYNHDVEEYW